MRFDPGVVVGQGARPRLWLGLQRSTGGPVSCLVMGAYGDGRLDEFSLRLGGATS
jgi:hypothetical protein